MNSSRLFWSTQQSFYLNKRREDENEGSFIKTSKHIGSDFKQYLYDESGWLRKNINILINGISIELSNIPKIEVKNRDNVVIAVIAGGRCFLNL